MVLNALAPAHAPIDKIYSPHPYWTQDALTAMSCVTANCSTHYGLCRGVSLGKGASALGCESSLHVTAHHARDASLPNATALEALLRANLGKGDAAVIANFIGSAMGLTHHGHFSPVVALADGADGVTMALVLDVSRYLYPPWWAPIEKLWAGIDTMDSIGLRRGVMVATVV